MEFSNDHDIVLTPVGSGQYQIIFDSYYEEDVTGFTPGDYVAPEVIGVPPFFTPPNRGRRIRDIHSEYHLYA